MMRAHRWECWGESNEQTNPTNHRWMEDRPEIHCEWGRLRGHLGTLPSVPSHPPPRQLSIWYCRAWISMDSVLLLVFAWLTCVLVSLFISKFLNISISLCECHFSLLFHSGSSWQLGRMQCNKASDGDGAPLFLVHSIAALAWELGWVSQFATVWFVPPSLFWEKVPCVKLAYYGEWGWYTRAEK